jgi:hypothetical protein
MDLGLRTAQPTAETVVVSIRTVKQMVDLVAWPRAVVFGLVAVMH